MEETGILTRKHVQEMINVSQTMTLNTWQLHGVTKKRHHKRDRK